jgi:hypothetical protein
MKRLLLVFALVFVCMYGFGQETADTIVVNKVQGGYQFLKNDVTMNMIQLTEIVRTNPQALSELSKAKTANAFANIFAYSGGYLLGYPCGTALAGGKMDWTMFGIGAGLALLTIPIANAINKHLKAAVDTYNANPNPTSQLQRTDVRLDVADNGFGFKMVF